MRRGLYRTHGVDGRPDGVRVDNDGIELPMEESIYRARGHLPLVDDLPWQDDYFNKQPAANETASSDSAKAAREQARREFRTRFDRR